MRNVELKARNATLEAKFASLEDELAALKVACTATEAEVKATLTQMKSVTMDATLHARAELMEEFKAGQHIDWNPNLEIEVW